MKTPLIILLATGLACASCSEEAAPPPPVDQLARSRIAELENQVQMHRRYAELGDRADAERGATDYLKTIAVSLGIGCTVMLLIGTALGSRTRHDTRLS